MAGTASTSTPVTVTNADGSTTTTVTLTYKSPAPVVAPPVTLPPVVTAPVKSVALSAVSLGKNGAMNGFLPLCTPEFYTDISAFPVDAATDKAWKDEYTVPSGDHFKLDATMTYGVVSGVAAVPLAKITYADESDNVPVPITAASPTEGGGMIGALNAKGKKIAASSGDHHTLILNRDTGKLYELFQTVIDTTKNTFSADALAVWDCLKTTRRPAGYTSADSAGLAILPLLLKFNELEAGEITHALRWTSNSQGGTIRFPATHTPNPGGGDKALPGMCIRLKASVDISKLDVRSQKIARGLKKYGAYNADQGTNMMFTADDDPGWAAVIDTINANMGQYTELDFEVVDTSSFKA